MLPEYVILKASPKNRVSRWAEDKVRRACRFPMSVTLPAKYKQWIVLNENTNVEKASGADCYFALQVQSGIRHYLAKDDIAESSKTVKKKASLW